MPVIRIYEVFKRILQQKGLGRRKPASPICKGAVIELTPSLAISAAAISDTLKLPMADSIIPATARSVWTPVVDAGQSLPGSCRGEYTPNQRAVGEDAAVFVEPRLIIAASFAPAFANVPSNGTEVTIRCVVLFPHHAYRNDTPPVEGDRPMTEGDGMEAVLECSVCWCCRS